MHIAHCQDNLDEPVHYLCFRDGNLILSVLTDAFIEISAFTEVCHDAQMFPFGICERVVILDDVGVRQLLEDFCLV